MTVPKNYKANSVDKLEKTADTDSLIHLKLEIKSLEQELSDLKLKLQPFQSLIYAQLHHEIRQLAELSELHKIYKADKKQKRLEQKKRGKNYKAPEPGLNTKTGLNRSLKTEESVQPELKKLYRDAIIKIHPDKISHNNEKDAIQAATDLTAQLNKLYKNGDLDELKLFYYSISDDNLPIKNQVNKIYTKDFKQVLIKTKQKLISEIESIKSSSLYYYLAANKPPQEFVDDLREILLVKIKKLEKRTKKN